MLNTFVNQNFDAAGNDLEQFNPKDWVERPNNLKRIKDKTLRSWAYDLNKLWKSLGRTVSADARKHSERSSLIVVDNPFIVPGGRFREYYYWDSYWILNGILVCGMNSTAKGMIENYIELVRRLPIVILVQDKKFLERFKFRFNQRILDYKMLCLLRLCDSCYCLIINPRQAALTFRAQN